MPKQPKRTILLITMLLGLTGCATNLPTQEEGISIPEQFSQSGEVEHSELWWQEFSDPQLNALIEQALTDNFSIQSSLARLEQAAAQSDIDASGLFPQVTGSAGQDYRRTLQDNGQINERDSFSAGLSASWELDLWGRIQHRSDAAAYEYLASNEALQSAAISLAGTIARTWYQLTEQSARLEILAEQLENIDRFVAVIRLRYYSGQESVSAVWRQEQLQESKKASYQEAIRQQQILTRQLNVLLGKTPASEPQWQISPFPTLQSLPSAGVPARLIETRPDIRDSWYQYQATRHRVAEAKAARLPSFSISAGTDASADSLNELFDFWATDLAVDLSIPIFQGGLLEGQQRRAEAQHTRAFYDYTETVLQALEEVETNLLEELSQEEQLLSEQKQAELAQQILNVESARYNTGIQEYLDVLNAQERLFNLQLSSISAERRLIDRRIALYQSLGGGFLSIDSDGALVIEDTHKEFAQ